MATISMFEGILIMMFYKGDHNPPHFHAKFAEFEASFSIAGDLLEGNMPANKTKLIVAWAELHKDELMANWELAQKNEPLYKIDPLR
jgi:hypothetical protein